MPYLYIFEAQDEKNHPIKIRVLADSPEQAVTLRDSKLNGHPDLKDCELNFTMDDTGIREYDKEPHASIEIIKPHVYRFIAKNDKSQTIRISVSASSLEQAEELRDLKVNARLGDCELNFSVEETDVELDREGVESFYIFKPHARHSPVSKSRFFSLNPNCDHRILHNKIGPNSYFNSYTS